MPPSPEGSTASSFPGRSRLLRHILFVLLTGTGGGAIAADQPRISLIIDDMGDRRGAGLAAIRLPGPVAYAFLPHSPHAAELATLAFRGNKEVLLHVPMQATSKKPLGPGAITVAMDRIRLIKTVGAGLKSVPYVSGISNHMGSKITSRREHMGWLMDLLRVRGNLYFVDSRTTHRTIALEMARSNGVPSTWRDVFLDNDAHGPDIGREFDRLIGIAKRRGTALAIGHPHAETISFLADMIPRLNELGIRLVPVARLIQLRVSETPPFAEAQSRAYGPKFPSPLTHSSASGHAAMTK